MKIFLSWLVEGPDAWQAAWAKPSGNSLYSTSVVGELAYRNNEPAVYYTMTTIEISRDVRGVSQEWVPIAQTVIPIRNHVTVSCPIR